MKLEMPIRAEPFAHQRAAFEFTLETFGVIECEDGGNCGGGNGEIGGGKTDGNVTNAAVTDRKAGGANENLQN